MFKKKINIIFLLLIIAIIAIFSGCAAPAAKSSGSSNTNVTAVDNSGTTYDVTNYGAIGDGVADDTAVINNVISICNANGGGTVKFPGTKKYLTGSIHLKSNVYLYVDTGATIFGESGAIDSMEPNPYAINGSTYQDYGHSHFHNALIWGENLNNIKITGKGTIDGGGTTNPDGSARAVPALTRGNPSTATPGDKAISLKLCTNVEIGGVDGSNQLTMQRFGHFAILSTGCDNVNIHDFTTPDCNQWSTSYNDTSCQRDVMDIMECNNVTVNNITSGYSWDDVIKLGSDYALGYVRPSNNINITNITANTNCNVCMIGSETVGPITNVSYSHITVKGTGKAAVGIMSNDGSIIDGVTINDVNATGVNSSSNPGPNTPFWIKITNRNRWPHDLGNLGSWTAGGPCIGKIKNVTISNVNITNYASTSSNATATIAGFKYTDNTVTNIENITFNGINIIDAGTHPNSDSTIVPPELNFDISGTDYNYDKLGTRPSYGFYLRYVNGIKISNTTVNFHTNDDRFAIVADTLNNLELDTITMAKGTGISNYVQLKNTVTNLNIHGCKDISGSSLLPDPDQLADASNTVY